MPEIVFEVVALDVQDVEGFVLDLPASPAGGSEFGDVVPIDPFPESDAGAKFFNRFV